MARDELNPNFATVSRRSGHLRGELDGVAQVPLTITFEFLQTSATLPVSKAQPSSALGGQPRDSGALSQANWRHRPS